MCDTMVALGNATKDGSVIFAKNSDRQPNEPHIVIRVPRKKHEKGQKLKCTYIEVEQSDESYEVLLLKPSWIWGAEMGSNEFGLTIGNEAVFTKEEQGEQALLGMDMLRIALERCKSSEEALNMLIYLLEAYGQGGNCGYEKKFTYHNSFLIADRNSAWVLETAGKYWAAERVKDIRSISNCLSIGKNYERHHPDLIKHAVDKGWCKNEEDFHFAKCYTSPLVTHLSKAKDRGATSAKQLEGKIGSITVHSMKEILRSHSDDIIGKQFTKHSLNSICMHGGFFYGDHTTGSYIAALNDNLDTHWVTGSSTPCISIFKPFWFIDGEQFAFTSEEKDKAIEYWKQRERLHRIIIENKISDLDIYINKRDALESDIDEKLNRLDTENADEKELLKIMNYATNAEDKLMVDTIKENECNGTGIKGTPYFKRYWKNKNRRLYK
ncbi:MAG TPA: C69 family dipeptidase [Patescibacteria group bacterium]|nr:C69 family dipeptidase [Patescibacteria group bacterium]